jgi:hypothetical protein
MGSGYLFVFSPFCSLFIVLYVLLLFMGSGYLFVFSPFCSLFIVLYVLLLFMGSGYLFVFFSLVLLYISSQCYVKKNNLTTSSRYFNNSTQSMIMIIVFNAIFNNISAIPWRSILFMAETGVPGKTTDMSQITDKFYCILLNRVHLALAGFKLTTLVVIG